MQDGMSHEVFFPGERLAAVFADEGLQLDVDVQLVHLQAGLPIEHLAAVFALEAVLPRVVEHVGVQAADLDELLAAESAGVGSDACVGSEMAAQGPLQGKSGKV